MRQITALILVFVISHTFLLAQKATVHGYVKDGESGEFLISATVLIKGTTKGTVTNVYGFYSLSLEPGEYTLVYTYIGYETIERTINLTNDTKISVELSSGTEQK